MRPVLHARRAVVLGVALLATPVLLALPAPASAAAAACHVDYRVLSEWPGAFTAGITVGNDGPDLNGWTLTWTFPVDGQTAVHGFNGEFHQIGRAMTVINAPYNPLIRTGRTVWLGVVGIHTGANPVPTDLALNGQPCTMTGGGPNLPPTVTLTVPQPGAVLAAGTGTLLGATASDPDGTVTEVRFFAGSDLVGIDTTSPYFTEWSIPFTSGTDTLTAVARDNSGAVTTSAPVPVIVLPPPTP